MPDYIYGEGSIEINAGRSVVTMTVRNTGDRAVQIGSHYHFFEANRALSFDRERAYGRRLDIPAGTAVRIEAGDSHRVDLVEYGGGMRVVGFAGLVNGGLRSEQTHRNAVARMAEQGFQNVRDATVKVRKPKSAKTELEVPKAARAAAKRPSRQEGGGQGRTEGGGQGGTEGGTEGRGQDRGQGRAEADGRRQNEQGGRDGQGAEPVVTHPYHQEGQILMATLTRKQYTDMYGPTVGDRFQLADTNLVVEVEKDHSEGLYGDEILYGGGKTARDGMGADPGSRNHTLALDMVITNVVVIDAMIGVVKGDIGIKNGRIAGIGKSGNPHVQNGVDRRLIVGPGTEVVSGEHLIATASTRSTRTCTSFRRSRCRPR